MERLVKLLCSRSRMNQQYLITICQPILVLTMYNMKYFDNDALIWLLINCDPVMYWALWWTNLAMVMLFLKRPQTYLWLFFTEMFCWPKHTQIYNVSVIILADDEGSCVKKSDSQWKLSGMSLTKQDWFFFLVQFTHPQTQFQSRFEEVLSFTQPNYLDCCLFTQMIRLWGARSKIWKCD